ncbi:hypothetical protein BRADI_4g09973v3 [Brachypodium distachyon]|uniref:Bowman-Birk serine protease inhibitors family domain-containing protein n=1 Tax=Brachypodium distachyon TaxID=15368 RepID=A0A2K2CLQ0_BRADI|nr:hypothetical protein BRADI_4g09973v3 [Brachypodium distachyon]
MASVGMMAAIICMMVVVSASMGRTAMGETCESLCEEACSCVEGSSCPCVPEAACPGVCLPSAPLFPDLCDACKEVAKGICKNECLSGCNANPPPP